MPARIYPIYYKEKEIYYTDWSNIKIESEVYAAIEETTSFVEKLGKYNLLEIIDVTNSISPSKAMGYVIDAAKRTKPYGKRKAIVGINGSKLLILKTVNRFINGQIMGFQTLSEAKEWVVKD